MKRLLTLLAFTSIFSLGGVNYIYSQEENTEKEIVAGHSEAVHDEIEHAAPEHEGGMEPLLFIIIALIIGAATRHFLRKSPLPYTVMLLLTGIGMGVAVRLGYFEGGLESISHAIEWAGNIDPHVILFVFLPTLIFEAAFAMDVHTFKKTLTNAIILAVPGIILAMLLTAALAIGLDVLGMGLSGWGWPIALMFGAVISATDPVAVVSLLKDLGVSKKLGTLIEGESLLNDGTAIVIFMVLFLGITGVAIESSFIVEFGRVALGGTLIGLIIAGVTIAWVKRVFNDPLVEITVIIAAAYLTFFVAEHFLHVSGVLGLVALGLAMAGVGKTRISPEVGHFLHEFWELAAFIANTLIFIIVGVVVAQRTVFTGMDFVILGIIYIGITVIRALVLMVLFPFMRKIGYGLPVKDAYVLWYGALRGAIGLALALIVAGEEKIDEDIRNQFLFHTAGIVTLTLLINATTIKFLVNYLGLAKIPAVKALMMSNAFQHLTNDTENALELMKSDRFMSGANWNSVREYLPKPKAPEISEEELAQMDTMAETRRRILEKEKKSYWHQFQDGLLGPVAVSRLSDGVNEVLDEGGSMPLSERVYLEQLWGTPKFLNKLVSIPVFGRFAKSHLSDRLAMSYDIARGFVVAQEEVVKLVQSLAVSGDDQSNSDDSDIVSVIREEIDKNRIRGLNFLKNVRETHPEIAAAIETKQAIRSVLNHERNTIKTLLNDGRIEHDEADKMLINVEERMKMLMDSPPSIQLPEPIELLKEVSWLKGLESETFNKVVDLVENRSYTPGKKLVEQGGPGDGLFIISRGTVKVTVGDYVIDILGPGSMIGEMAVLTGGKRTATVTAETPVTALWMKSSGMQEVMKGSKELEDRLWDTAGKRFAENLLGRSEPYSQWRQIQFKRWLSQGEVISLKQDEILKLDDKAGVLISGLAYRQAGEAFDKSKTISAPAVLDKAEFTLSSDARVFVRSTKEA